MKKLMVVLLILTLGLSLVFTSCGTAGSGGTVFNWNIGADPKTIDPGLNGASEGGDVINQTFECLVREAGWQNHLKFVFYHSGYRLLPPHRQFLQTDNLIPNLPYTYLHR